MKKKLLLSLREGDLATYRRHFNLPTVHFSGLNLDPVGNLIHDDEADPSEDSNPVTTFLDQVNVRDRNAAGFWPHALCSFVEQPANHQAPACGTRESEPKDKQTRDHARPSTVDVCIGLSHVLRTQPSSKTAALRPRLPYRWDPSQHARRVNVQRGWPQPSLCPRRQPQCQQFVGIFHLGVCCCFWEPAAVEQLLAWAQHGPREL